ncbi:hypothetical protein F8388_011023 [Cannabis sativa]|uniref:Uncharacterized protein n=1 Tax=Cannabis sativa TaxID=3483 RepID=A0A7J6FQM3_CANSA|nr:hypothetical protein F8388_011023 [Cannabis sativa]
MNIDTNNEEQHSNNQRNEENQEATNDYAVKIMEIHSNIRDDEIPKLVLAYGEAKVIRIMKIEK